MQRLILIAFLFVAQRALAVITPDEFATKVAGLDDISFKEQLESKWQDYEKRYFGKLVHFQQKELAKFIPAQCVAFVPNVNLNILPVFAIYPLCRLYLLTGSYEANIKYIWNAEDLNIGAIKETTLEMLDLDSSFYVARAAPPYAEFTTLTLSLLKVLGDKVLSIIPIFLHTNGEISVDTEKDALSGVQIAYRINDKLPIQAIVYFPAGDEANRALSLFLQNQERLVSLIAKTHYELQRPAYQQLAENIIAKSWIILQDETGVPFKDINSEQWYIKHYGYYLRPAASQEDFEYFQEELFSSYNKLGAEKISFNYSLSPFYNSLSFLMKKDIVKLYKNEDEGR